MLQKWKSILLNWINCYFNDSRSQQNLNLESLMNIISHLRENLNLDESKSSKLSAHNVEEFIVEKYPEFKFENGTVEATNEEQVCLAASLLLYFVCVNSKDIDIKSAMCSKLSDADQEIILKFSKSLMDCSPILCRDVQAAIADACGHNMVATSSHVKVAETPPALRSLHSEVRRLQAALDAERFDRNYLQDELNRTNLRVEKLLKEKEEYKMDIVDLKTKISLCCGQEDEARGTESSSDKSAKLARQLHEMEERLVQTQGELDDAVYQRDTYKAKAEELKQDRDKWLTLSQQETVRVSQLSEELEVERRNSQSLRELVGELRQHNRLNRIDSSFLECDDPDASIQSLPHNSSICSEVCANVVEVQLGEERAKIVVLKQQIEALQDQINELTRKSEDERLTLETIVTERETEVFNLKHRINEEIEEKNNLRAHFSDEMSKLNNEINELEQKLKDNNDHSRSMIEQKMQEIQTLQEEKLSLLQSLSDETTKLENIIKDLKTNIETERLSKINMKESYDSHVMKLNEKMLNRNNELVELQNNVFEKSEMIESLHFDLRREKEMKEDISNKYHNDMSQLTEQKNLIEHCLQERMRENTELTNMLEQKTSMIECLYREVENLKQSLSNCNDNCKLLEEGNSKLINEIQSRDRRHEEIYKDIENLKNVFSEERGKLCFDLDERNATINTLKMQLENEIHYKIGLENELISLQKAKSELMEKLNQSSVEIAELRSTIKEKDKNIKHMDTMLQKETHNNKQSKSTIEKLNKQLNKLSDDLKFKNNEQTLLNSKIKELHKSFQDEIKNKDDIIEKCNNELTSLIATKKSLQVDFNSLTNKNDELEKAIVQKADMILRLQEENNDLRKTVEEKADIILRMQKGNDELKNFIAEKADMILRMQKEMDELTKAGSEKANIILQMRKENDKLTKNATDKADIVLRIQKDNDELTKTLAEKADMITRMQKEMDELTKAGTEKANIILQMRNENDKLTKKLTEKADIVLRMQKANDELTKTTEGKADMISQMQKEIDELIRAGTEKADIIIKMQKENDQLATAVTEKINMISRTQKENDKLTKTATEKINIVLRLQQEIDELTKTAAEKTNIILRMQKDIDELTISVAQKADLNLQIEKENDDLSKAVSEQANITLQMQKENYELSKAIVEKTDMIMQIQKENDELTKVLEEHSKVILTLQEKLQTLHQKYSQLEHTFDKETSKMIAKLNETEKIIKELSTSSKKTLNKKEFKIQTLNMELDNIRKFLENNQLYVNTIQNEKHALKEKLDEQISYRNTIEEEYQSQCTMLVENTAKFSEELCVKNTEIENLRLQLKTALQAVEDKHSEMSKETEVHKTAVNTKVRELQQLQHENETLRNDLNDVKLQLEVKVHSLKEKLTDNELLTDKLKTSYECQIDNLNMMITKLTAYLKEKTVELEAVRKEKETLHHTIEENLKAIKSLETEVQTEKKNQQKLINDFDSERLILKNMVTVTESVMEDQKIGLNNIIAEHVKINESLQEENKILKDSLENEKCNTKIQLQDKDVAIEKASKELAETQEKTQRKQKELEAEKENMEKEIRLLKDEISFKSSELCKLQIDNKRMEDLLQKHKDDIDVLQNGLEKSKFEQATLETEMQKKINDVVIVLNEQQEINMQLEAELKEKIKLNENVKTELLKITDKVVHLEKEKHHLELASIEWRDKFEEVGAKLNMIEAQEKEVLETLEKEKIKASKEVEDQKIVIKNLEQLIKHELQENQTLRNDNANEKLTLIQKFSLLQDVQMKAKKDIEEKQKEITHLQEEVITLQAKIDTYEHDLKAKDTLLLDIGKEKDAIISTVSKELLEEKTLKEKWQLECENVIVALNDKQAIEAALRKENEELVKAIGEKETLIKSLETDVQIEKNNHEKLISDFESERLILKNMVTVTESVMEDQKIGLNNVITEHVKINESLQVEIKILKDSLENEKNNTEIKMQEKDIAIEKALKELSEIQEKKLKKQEELDTEKANLEKEIKLLRDEISLKSSELCKLHIHNKTMEELLQKDKHDIEVLQNTLEKSKLEKATLETEMQKKMNDVVIVLNEQKGINTQLEAELKEKSKLCENVKKELQEITERVVNLEKEKHDLELASNEWKNKFEEVGAKWNLSKAQEKEVIETLEEEKIKTAKAIEDQKIVITNLELLIKHELEENQMLRDDNANEKFTLVNKFSLLQDWQMKAEKDIEEKQKEITHLQEEVMTLRAKIDTYEHDLKAKDTLLSDIGKEKDAIISTISKELLEEKTLKENWQKECESKITALYDMQAIEAALRKENEELVKIVGERETFAAQNTEKSNSYPVQVERDCHQQVDNSSEITQSSMESLKTITDLEKIIHDKNRKITTLQSDITYLKTLMAESETKLMDVTNDLEVSKENCQQLSNQLKKIMYQKNEEIAELKKQVNKMSVTENRATQIIKVSAKYQAIILKRIAEIKSNTVLKELTNFGNSNNSENEVRRSLNAGTVTMEDLENFLETTDRHLKRCSEKQFTMQKERDRLSEVNRINESEIINLKKFLTELSVSFQTFNSVKDLYSQKLSRVVSIQRTVRREILNLDGHVTDSCMCRLERGYAAVMQDLAECSMNLERWVERCLSRAISPEKIKQAFMADYERASLASTSFQNAGLEVQLEELDSSFQKLLEEVARAVKGDGAKDAAALTVLEVRAEYEDKLNRMKAKMKQLYQEQIGVFKEKQREEVAMLEREVQKAREKLAESSQAYEQHIRALTTELWSVGEKFLMKKDEAEWLRRKQRSDSLMSLQHVHSSGLVPPQEEPGRPSDTHSLRSLPAHNNTKREGRGLHMSDEEGEVFDNRFLKELATPRKGRESGVGPGPGQGPGQGVRLSELRWRNSLCPPHLKSSYPAETQFAPALDEEDIKFASAVPGRPQRKEVGITAYKKPGPPTPSKQAGRLSATDSELRESLRVEADPLPSRKTSTPSRIRALFRSAKNETNEGTPRTRRLSNIFRKK